LEFESDLHTHTNYSHGSGTIEDNVKAAISKGLKTIGIAEHGPGEIGIGVSRKRLAEMKAEVIRLRNIYPEIEILFGIEANIYTPSGRLDIDKSEYEFFDYVSAGWHYGAIDGFSPKGIGNTIGNFIHSTPAKASKRQIINNTDAMVSLVKSGGVMFLTHPGARAPIDILKVAIACARADTLFEINTHHMPLSADDIKMLAELTDVRFIVNSDAHSPSQVGDFEPAVRLIEASGLDPARVYNVKKDKG
jgi:putative hydrolase